MTDLAGRGWSVLHHEDAEVVVVAEAVAILAGRRRPVLPAVTALQT